MRMLSVAMLSIVMLSMVFSGTAFAQQYTNVANLTSFSVAANHMSLPGYLRYLTYQQSNLWLTYEEASRIVKQQVSQ